MRARIVVDPGLSRAAVSYQGNKGLPGFRWFRFKEGFSTALVEECLSRSGGRSVLDPFSGSGTTVMTACRMGRRSVGIDVMPIGQCMVDSMSAMSNGTRASDVRDAAGRVLAHVSRGGGRFRTTTCGSRAWRSRAPRKEASRAPSTR